VIETLKSVLTKVRDLLSLSLFVKHNASGNPWKYSYTHFLHMQYLLKGVWLSCLRWQSLILETLSHSTVHRRVAQETATIGRGMEQNCPQKP